MSAIHSKNIQIYNAKKFKESVSGPSAANLYFTFGRCVTWPNENAPPQANTTGLAHYEVWNNMIGGKKITGNDIRHCIPRINWTTNTVYNAYDDRIDNKEQSNFYVLTEDYRIYKCIANNYGVVSTVKPTSASTVTDFQTADGYVWKFMYELTSEEQLRFLTDDYMPVKSLTTQDGSLQWGVQNNAISGAIHNIVLTHFGNNYSSDAISISINGDGQDANAFAIRNVTSNTISSIVIDNKGLDYSFANVSIVSSSGSNAAARVVISPPGGHGSNPLTELGGSNLIIHVQLKGSESNKLTIQNEYRQVALIENPLVFGTSNSISNSAVSQLTVLNLSGTSAEYIEDEYIYQGSSLQDATYSAIVTEWDSSNNKLKVSNVTGEPGSELITGHTSTGARYLSSINNPDMERFTGNLLYMDNIIAIDRAFDQAEDFKIILTF